MSRTVAVVGAGLVGRLLALRLARRGWRVTLFDASAGDAAGSAAAIGAGMLAPVCELEHADPALTALGLDSPQQWAELESEFRLVTGLQAAGSLVIAHARDEAELTALQRKVAAIPWARDRMQAVDRQGLTRLEPALGGRFPQGLFFPAEGQVDNDAVLRQTALALHRSPGVQWLAPCPVTRVEPGRVTTAAGTVCFDLVADTRGVGARADLGGLRGVRGELIHVETGEVTLRRPVRLMHPRYPLYIVPRADGRFVIGATLIESEDVGPVTARAALELLSAAYTVHPAFAEARVVDLRAGLRPTFRHHEPRLQVADGLVVLNGLYRHGFLLAPALTELAARLAEGESLPPASGWARFVEWV
jgi:glycine oxidase